MNEVKNKCVNCGKEILTPDSGDYVCSHVCQNEYTNKTTTPEEVLCSCGRDYHPTSEQQCWKCDEDERIEKEN